jgi:hypothetical protein
MHGPTKPKLKKNLMIYRDSSKFSISYWTKELGNIATLQTLDDRRRQNAQMWKRNKDFRGLYVIYYCYRILECWRLWLAGKVVRIKYKNSRRSWWGILINSHLELYKDGTRWDRSFKRKWKLGKSILKIGGEWEWLKIGSKTVIGNSNINPWTKLIKAKTYVTNI